MSKNKKPILSIGMIFKNEIRCLERCMKSLLPLRDAIPCELVMADTGSDDGSREIAEKYADILFDFPWIDDFAAARNAVIDRCSGKWYLSIDADEWLDENISELKYFLLNDKSDASAGIIFIRNYFTYNMNDDYSDFKATRLLRMSTGIRYRGAIHEFMNIPPTLKHEPLLNTLLHHDGYVNLNTEDGKAKRERNLTSIRELMNKEPENLRNVMMYIESGTMEADYIDTIYRAVDLVRSKPNGWKRFGPPVIRYAVFAAEDKKLPELREWITMAEEWFPDSFFTKIDVEYAALGNDWENQEYSDCIKRGECYLKAVDDLKKHRGDETAQAYGSIMKASPSKERKIKLFLADAYIKEGQLKNAVELLNSIHFKEFDANQTMACLVILLSAVNYGLEHEVPFLVLRLYNEICIPEPSEAAAGERRRTFILNAGKYFNLNYIKNEKNEKNFKYHAYIAFAPLAGKCEIGTAAAILESEDNDEIRNLLITVENWNEFPIIALKHVLDKDIDFPLIDKLINFEDMESLLNRLMNDKEAFFKYMQKILDMKITEQLSNGLTQNRNEKYDNLDTENKIISKLEDKVNVSIEKSVANALSPKSQYGNLQKLVWIQNLIWAAVRTFDWQRVSDNNETSSDIFSDDYTQVFLHKDEYYKFGISLAKTFADIERQFISVYYNADILCDEYINILPPVHRLGWYCANAFETLDLGDTLGYIRRLKQGLNTYKDMKMMIKFLIENTPGLPAQESEALKPSEEMLELAKQIRTILNSYPEDDPAVRKLKASPAYQKVAYLLEDIEKLGKMLM